MPNADLVIAEALRPLAVPIDNLQPDPENARRGDVPAIRRSLNAFGQRKPVIVKRTGADTEGRPTGIVIAGNHTLAAATELGWPILAAVFVDDDAMTARAYALADNRTGELATWDDDQLAATLRDLAGDPSVDMDALGWTSDDLAALLSADADDEGTSGDSAGRPSLADRFIVPPFSVLDARSGRWRDRKRAWLSTGVGGGDGRGNDLLKRSDALNDIDHYRDAKKAATGRAAHLAFNNKQDYMPGDDAAGTSMFDPVLCELAYRWFSPAGGTVLDPWAGGAVRGLVAALLGRSYVGVELRPEQIAANEAGAAAVLRGGEPAPRWLPGDAIDVLPTVGDADLIFGCPPYFDLEQYSDDPRDLSAMTADGFAAAYTQMIGLAADRLRPDRFAVLVVSAARDGRTGALRDLRGLTVDAADAAGLALYNELALVTPAGSLPIRAAGSFVKSRIIGRTHQDVLVFVKGDRRRAADACGDVDAADVEAALADAADGGGTTPTAPDA